MELPSFTNQVCLPVLRKSDLPGLHAYIERLKGAAKLRPDSKLALSRDWPTPEARLTGAMQLSRGLARVAAAGDKAAKQLEPA